MNTMPTSFSTVEGLLAQPLVNALGWALVHFLWQGAAVAAVVAVLLVVLRRASANVRYLVACAAMLALAATPVATACYVYRDPPSRPSTSVDRPEMPLISSNEVLRATAASPPRDFVRSPSEAEHSAVLSMPLATPALPPARPLFARAAAWIERALPWLVAAWLAGVLGLSVRLLAGWAHVQRIRRRHARPAAEPWPTRLADLARRLRVSRTVRLLESAMIEVPIAIGWFRPVILLPASALVGLTPQQLESLLAHELAHIRRHDYLVNLVQTFIETLLFYHPVVRWVSSRIRQEREACSDDLAIGVSGDRLAYARALATMEGLRSAFPQFALSAGGGALLGRIRRLLGAPAPRSNPAIAWLIGLIVLVAWGAWAAHVIGDPGNSSASAALSSDAPRPREPDDALEQIVVAADPEPPRLHDSSTCIVAVDPVSGEWNKLVERAWLVRVAPDGASLAYSQPNELWIRDSDGQSRKALDLRGMPHWFPDGQSLLFTRSVPPDGSWKYETWRVQLDGTPPKKLQIPEDVGVNDISPDGRWFVATIGRQVGKGCDLYLVRADGDERRLLSQSSGWSVSARFSPDGRHVLYTHHDGDETSPVQETLWVVDVAGRKRECVVTDPGVAVRGCWSPDGSRLALVMWDWNRDESGKISGHINHRIEIANRDGGDRRRLNTKPLTFWMNSEPSWIRIITAGEPAKAPDEPEPPPGDWGPEKDGLRTRLVLLTEEPAVGQPLEFRLEMKNFGKAERRFDPQVAAPFRVVTVKKENGEAEPYVGLLYQTSGGPEPIKPGETKVLWDDFDVAESFLLAEPGKYVVQSSVLPSNSVTVELAPGKVPELKAMFLRMREILPEGKAWRISMSGRVIFFTHSPTNLKRDVTTIQLWFDEKEHPPGYSLGEGANKIAVDRLGKTPLGFAYMTAPAKAASLWPEFREQIRGKLQSHHEQPPQAASPAATPGLKLRVLDVDGQATNSVYVNVWRRVGRAEADERSKNRYDAVWRDTATGESWARHRHWAPRGGDIEQLLASLEPGEYRVSAADYADGKTSDATPFGTSDVVPVEEAGQPPTVTVQLQGDTPLVVKLVDSTTREPVRGAGLRLVRWDGVPVAHGRGSAWLYAATDDRGEVSNRRLVPGTYWVEIAGKSASQFEPIEYPAVKDRTRVEVTRDKENSVEIALERVELSEAEQDKRWPWIAVGRVTDDAGKPVEKATVRAHCGHGTLPVTGTATTDGDGRYKMRFTGGVSYASENPHKPHPQFQAALISASKPGFTERSLGRQGGLSMATRIPAADEGWEIDPERTVLPNKPFEVNFVLTPAVTLDLVLLDDAAKPIAGRSVSIKGKELPPGSNVIEYGKTDAAGRIRFERVPPGHAWWITAGLSDSWRDGEVRTQPLTFEKSGPYRAQLRLRTDAETNVNLLEFQSVTDAAGAEVRDAVVGVPMPAASALDKMPSKP